MLKIKQKLGLGNFKIYTYLKFYVKKFSKFSLQSGKIVLCLYIDT